MTVHYGAYSTPACGKPAAHPVLSDFADDVTCGQCHRTETFKARWYDSNRYPPGSRLVGVENTTTPQLVP